MPATLLLAAAAPLVGVLGMLTSDSAPAGELVIVFPSPVPLASPIPRPQPFPVELSGQAWRLNQGVYLPPHNQYTVFTRGEPRPGVNLVDIQARGTVLTLDTGSLPAAQFVASTQELVVVDHLPNEGVPPGYPVSGTGLVPRLMVFDLSTGIMRKVVEVPLPGYVFDTNVIPFALAASVYGGRAGIFVAPAPCDGPPDPVALCERYDVRAFSLETGETTTILAGLGAECGRPLISTVASQASITCPETGIAWAARPGGAWSGWQVIPVTPSATTSGANPVRAALVLGYDPSIEHAAVFADGSVVHTFSPGSVRLVRAIPQDKAVVEGLPSAATSDGRYMVIPYAEPGANQAEGLAVFNAASGHIDRVIDIPGVTAIQPFDYGGMLAVDQRKDLVLINLSNGYTTRLLSTEYPFPIIPN